jgi:aldehyde dehydrogenase
MIADIAREVIARLQRKGSAAAVAPTALPVLDAPLRSEDGVFESVDAAVKAAADAQRRVAALSLEERGRMVAIVQRICEERAGELARMELEETQLGRLDHKIEKLKAVRHVLGVEALQTSARSDASGLCVIENAPFGVIGMILPATHPVPTMAGNAVNVLASGNTAVFSPHPVGARTAAHALQIFHREIRRETGVENVITTVRHPGIAAAEEIFHHPMVGLICVTGGPAVVQAAAKSGKRVIAAGPGNPPVVVDETADLDRAAAAVIEGAAFDNNLLCIGEKEVFVVQPVLNAFVAAMRKAGAYELDAAAIDRLTRAAFHFEKDGGGCAHAHLNKELVGKDAAVLAAAAGVRVPANTPLLFGCTAADHPFVQEEQMMPFLPVVGVRDFEAAVAEAVKAERGYRHTAMIHSRDVEHVTTMARAMNTTLFVHNAPCFASLGIRGPGYLSYSIATPTGEGVTTPLTFTRQRQLTVGGGLRIV